MKKSLTFLFIFALAQLPIHAQNIAPLQQSATPQFAPIPPQMAVQNPSQNIQKQPTPPPPDPEKFANLFPNINGDTAKIGLPFWKEHWHYILISAIALIVILAILLRKKRLAPIPPIDRALQRIAIARQNSEKLSAKMYALEISQAVRDYIEDKHNLPAPERTTQEFLKLSAQAEIFDDDARKLLQKILTLSDMAKFAQHSFQNQERDELALLSIEFIESDDIKASNDVAPKTDENKTSSETEGAQK